MPVKDRAGFKAMGTAIPDYLMLQVFFVVIHGVSVGFE